MAGNHSILVLSKVRQPTAKRYCMAGIAGLSIFGAKDVSTRFSRTRCVFKTAATISLPPFHLQPPFSPSINQQPDQKTRYHRHSKIHQACHIPRAWVKTAPPRHIHSLAMPEHFDPAIFCLGVFTRNEERTTGYRPVSPVSGKKTNQYLRSHSTKCMKERCYIHFHPTQ